MDISTHSCCLKVNLHVRKDQLHTESTAHMQLPQKITIFVGTDQRQALGSEAFMYSVNKYSSELVFYNFLNESVLKQKKLLPDLWDKDQLSTHGRSRFLVPYLSNYEGWSLFVDGSDMMLRQDIANLWALRDDHFSVMVVKHPDFDRDFQILGREHIAFNRFNWSSVMLFNNSKCKQLTPEYVLNAPYKCLHQFQWLESDNLLGQLPRRWNHLVGFYPYEEDTSLIHWTKGAPHLGAEYLHSDYAEEWTATASEMLGITQSDVVSLIAAKQTL
jgi:hypothetical protein